MVCVCVCVCVFVCAYTDIISYIHTHRVVTCSVFLHCPLSTSKKNESYGHTYNVVYGPYGPTVTHGHDVSCILPPSASCVLGLCLCCGASGVLCAVHSNFSTDTSAQTLSCDL